MIFNTTGGGGSANLNFQIVGGTDQPENPRENTIWVNTDTEITGWQFSADEPAEAYEGMAWIRTGQASPVAFNAIKKNAAFIYPVNCFQYVNGAFERKTPLSYIRSGEALAWRNWREYLINDGKRLVSLSFPQGGTFTEGAEYATFSSVGNAARIGLIPLDVTPYTKFVIEIVRDGSSYQSTHTPGIQISSGYPVVDNGNANVYYTLLKYKKLNGAGQTGIYELDISAYRDVKYLSFTVSGTQAATGYIYIKNLWLE